MSEQTTTATTEHRPAPDDLSTLDLDGGSAVTTLDEPPAGTGDPELFGETGETGETGDDVDTGRPAHRAADPAAHAEQLAADLGAEVVTDLRAAEAAVRARRDAARLVLADGDGDADLLARAEAIRAAAAEPAPVDAAQVAEIRQLAAELRAATRIRERTEAKAVDELRERLSAYAGLTVHPSAIRAAADAVAVAAAAVAEAELALAEAGEPLVMAELSEGETHE